MSVFVQSVWIKTIGLIPNLDKIKNIVIAIIIVSTIGMKTLELPFFLLEINKLNINKAIEKIITKKMIIFNIY